MRNRVIALAIVAAAALCDLAAGQESRTTENIVQSLAVTPKEVRLHDRRARQQLLVTGTGREGYVYDLTRDVTFEIANKAIATIDSDGVVRPLQTGKTGLK